MSKKSTLRTGSYGASPRGRRVVRRRVMEEASRTFLRILLLFLAAALAVSMLSAWG